MIRNIPGENILNMMDIEKSLKRTICSFLRKKIGFGFCIHDSIEKIFDFIIFCIDLF